MTPEMFLKNSYYYMKPFIPRWLQIKLRRSVILRKRLKHSDVWPIYEKASEPPEGWSGWPEAKKFALVLTHDVESPKGVGRCMELARLEERLGFRASFNFVAEGYRVSQEVFDYLKNKGFEIGVHGLTHKGNPFRSKEVFQKQAAKINQYLKEWSSVGFRSPSMYHNLDWIGELDIDYDASTFDTDPFEPQPDGIGTIFPFWVTADGRAATTSAISSLSKSNTVVLQPPTSNLQPLTVSHMGFVELPYTLAQDFTSFILTKEKNIDIWKKKLDWIANNGGMALLNTHPDYMNFDGKKLGIEEYPARYYEEFLEYMKNNYEGEFWHVLPKEMARFWAKNYVNRKG